MYYSLTNPRTIENIELATLVYTPQHRNAVKAKLALKKKETSEEHPFLNHIKYSLNKP